MGCILVITNYNPIYKYYIVIKIFNLPVLSSYLNDYYNLKYVLLCFITYYVPY